MYAGNDIVTSKDIVTKERTQDHITPRNATQYHVTPRSTMYAGNDKIRATQIFATNAIEFNLAPCQLYFYDLSSLLEGRNTI